MVVGLRLFDDDDEAEPVAWLELVVQAVSSQQLVSRKQGGGRGAYTRK